MKALAIAWETLPISQALAVLILGGFALYGMASLVRKVLR